MQKINIKKKFQQDRRKLTEMEQMNRESEDEPLKFDPILRVKFKKKRTVHNIRYSSETDQKRVSFKTPECQFGKYNSSCIS